MDIEHFLATHHLPSCYQNTVQKWFVPLCDRIVNHHCASSKPFILGISGSQGSGKTTLSHFIETYLTSDQHKTVVVLSIDDFYLDQQSRMVLADKIHPLFNTRGVPGTHDMTLAINTFNQLQNGVKTAIPRFNKAIDNPYPKDQWPIIDYHPDIIILEGWCVNLKPQQDEDLTNPVNQFEQDNDPLRIWRSNVNKKLAGDYQTLFAMIDYKVFLKAPSFDCVFNWRLEQEQKLASKLSGLSNSYPHQGVMSESKILDFIQHYQRLTEHALQTLPDESDTVFFLDDSRRIYKQIVSK